MVTACRGEERTGLTLVDARIFLHRALRRKPNGERGGDALMRADAGVASAGWYDVALCDRLHHTIDRAAASAGDYRAL